MNFTQRPAFSRMKGCGRSVGGQPFTLQRREPSRTRTESLTHPKLFRALQRQEQLHLVRQLQALALSQTLCSSSKNELSSQWLLEYLDFHILVSNELPIIFPSLEIMFMGHLGKRISSQFIIDKVYIFNNGIRTSGKLCNCTTRPPRLGVTLIQDYSPSDYTLWKKHKTWK